MTTHRSHRSNDNGSVIVLVLVLAVLLMGILAVAVSSSTYSGTLATRYYNTSQAALAAQAGVSTELGAMRAVSTYANLPCGAFSGNFTLSGAVSSWSGTVTYYPSGTNPTALTCSGSTLGGGSVPATATIASTGSAPHGVSTTVHADIQIATTSTPALALGYALFTSNSLNLTGAAALSNSTGNVANVYSGNTLTCGNGDVIPGSVTTYAIVSFTGSCTVGGLTASGQVTLGNSAAVNGNLISYGTSITMTGTAKVTGNATETSGNISLPSGSPTITGNADASGTITTAGGASIGGTRTQLDGSLSSQTMPAAVSFPTLNPAVADWQSAGWTVVQIPGTVHGVAQTCASYFKSNSSGAADPWQSDIAAETTKTVYYAPTCNPSYTRSQTFSFAADTVLQIATLTTANSDTYGSTTATHHDVSILASTGTPCSTSSTDISVSNSSNFGSTLTVFFYTPGAVSYANAPSMTGQITACGGITGSNSFALTFDPQASGEIPGSSTATAPTITIVDKYIK